MSLNLQNRISCLLQHWLSSFAGVLANCRIVWFKNILIQYFIWRYPINLKEAVKQDPFQYSCFNELFTRQLQKSARPISNNPDDLVSPVDGKISQIGLINETEIIQAKGHFYSVHELLGKNSKYSQSFINGSFVTIYLAPKDYHRVHMPIDGQLLEMLYVPGELFSVSPKTAQSIPKLFARNERVVTLFKSSIGYVGVVLVGATIVGSIETTWAGTIMPPRLSSPKLQTYENSIYLKRGEELGHFKFGSTVILLLPQNTIAWEPKLSENSLLKFGERLGSFKPAQS